MILHKFILSHSACFFTYNVGAIARYGSFYGFVRGQSHRKRVLVSDLQCTGSEFRLLDCTRGTYSVKNCGQYNEAGVTCQGILLIMHVHKTYYASN